ncbi:unnamed protein product, partial [Mesorhabditis spiculigera]
MDAVSTASPKRNASSGDPGSSDANMNSKPGTTVKSFAEALAVAGVEPDSPPNTLLNTTQEPRPIVDIELPEFDWRGPRDDQYPDKDSQLCIDPRDFQQTVRPLPEFKLKRGFAQNAILDAEEDKRQARRQKMEKERSAQEAMAALQKGMADAFEEYTHHCQAIGISSQARRRRMVLQPLIT